MIDDDGKLKTRLSNKRVNASKEGIECNLSLDDVERLLEEAGLKSSDWSRLKGYDLARYGDEGPYEYGNCRFITHKENMKEKRYVVPTEEQDVNRRKALNIARTYLTPDILSKAGRKGANIANKDKVAQSIVNRKDIVQLVLSSGIDVTKYGWKSAAAKLCEVSHTEIARAFDLYYDGETYKRA